MKRILFFMFFFLCASDSFSREFSPEIFESEFTIQCGESFVSCSNEMTAVCSNTNEVIFNVQSNENLLNQEHSNEIPTYYFDCVHPSDELERTLTDYGLSLPIEFLACSGSLAFCKDQAFYICRRYNDVREFKVQEFASRGLHPGSFRRYYSFICVESLDVEDGVEVCESDGLPLHLNGYYGCDRPDLKVCPDRTFIPLDDHCPDYIDPNDENPDYEVPPCDNSDKCLAFATSHCESMGKIIEGFSYVDNLDSDNTFNYNCINDLVPVPDDKVCSDGYPPNLNNYYECDRPDLKICFDGSFVTRVSDCPTDWSKDTVYIGGENDNDKSKLGELCVNSEGDNSVIGLDGFCILIRSVGQDVSENLSQNFDSLTSSVGEGNSILSDISVSLDKTNSILQKISGNPDESGDDCGFDLDCLVPTYNGNNYSSVGDINDAYLIAMESSPIISSFQNVNNLIVFEQPSCTPLSFYLGWPIEQQFSSSLHCKLMVDYINPVLFVIFKIIWIYAGFRIVASA